MLARVADAAGGQDVADPIRAAAVQRHAVILLKRPDAPAIGPCVLVLGDKVLPLVGGEEALRARAQGAMLLAFRSNGRRDSRGGTQRFGPSAAPCGARNARVPPRDAPRGAPHASAACLRGPSQDCAASTRVRTRDASQDVSTARNTSLIRASVATRPHRCNRT